jgi:hypothetical protein
MLIRAIAVMAICCLPVSATIINVPGDYGTIQGGIEVSSAGDTVLVQPGIYLENINFNGHNIVVGSLFLTAGDTSFISQTKIDGDASGSVVTFENSEDSSAELIGFTVQNGHAERGGGVYCSNASPTICFNIIAGNTAFSSDDGKGGGIFCEFSNMILENNVIRNNYCSGPLGGYGGGVYCGYNTPFINGNVIRNNLGDWAGGGIYFDYCDAVFSQNVVANNTATVYGGGMLCYNSNTIIRNVVCLNNESSWAYGGGLFSDASIPLIVNCIFWGDSSFDAPYEIYVESGEPIINYTDIQGGWYQGEGILNVDPGFRDPDNSDYHLTSTDCGDAFNSPCIDAGSPSVLDSLLDCDWGLGTVNSDLGAYGGGDSTVIGINDDVPQSPHEYSLSPNYPNPFNATTVIKYDLPNSAEVTINILDILGRHVESLVNGKQGAGRYGVIWNGQNRPSGLYIYVLHAGDYTESRKMLLLK